MKLTSYVVTLVPIT